MIAHITASSRLLVPFEFSVMKISCFSFSIKKRKQLGKTSNFQGKHVNFSPCHFRWYCSKYAFHHCEVFAIVVCLEERNAQVKLEHDTANRPNIARLRPSQLQDDFRCSVVPCGHNRAVMLMVERGATKVNKPHVCTFDFTDFAILQMWIKTMSH